MIKDMNRAMALMIGMVFCLMIFAVSSAEASGMAFVGKLFKKDAKEISHIARGVNVGGLKKVLPDAGTLSRKFNLPEHMLTSPAVRKLAIAGEGIVSQGAFASKMLNKSDVPELVIHQYSRFGKQLYLKVAESVGKTMTTSKATTSASLSKLKGKYKGMNEVINKFNAGKYDDDIFVRTIRKTGKHGMETLKWLANHPKLALSGAAIAWYNYDPEGFEAALTASGKTLGAFVGGTVVNASAGVAEGVSSGLQKSFELHSITSVIGGVLAIGLTLLLVFSKTVRRLLLFPFSLLGKKANAKMDNLEQPFVRTSGNPGTNHDQKNPPGSTRKPKCNL